MRDRGSVFSKLVAAMVVMATLLLVLVTVFFFYSVGPSINGMLYRIAEEYSRTVAASSPDSVAAKALARRLDLQVRFESPAKSWSTASWLPTIADFESGRVGESHSLLVPKYFVVPGGAAGERYLFAWRFSERIRAAHAMLII